MKHGIPETRATRMVVKTFGRLPETLDEAMAWYDELHLKYQDIELQLKDKNRRLQCSEAEYTEWRGRAVYAAKNLLAQLGVLKAYKRKFTAERQAQAPLRKAQWLANKPVRQQEHHERKRAQYEEAGLDVDDPLNLIIAAHKVLKSMKLEREVPFSVTDNKVFHALLHYIRQHFDLGYN